MLNRVLRIKIMYYYGTCTCNVLGNVKEAQLMSSSILGYEAHIEDKCF